MPLANCKSKVYVDLDSLLDTRLGTLNRIDPEIGIKYLTNPDYYTRDEDKFEGVDDEVFREMYNKRDKETLSVSSATQFCLELGRIVIDLVTESHVSPTRGEVSVTVNTYPYILNKEEKEAIKACVMFYTKETVDVDVIYKPLEELDGTFFKQDYVAIAMYHYIDWIELHLAKIAMDPLFDINFIAPQIFFIDKPTDEEDLKEMGDSETAFNAMELLMRGCFNLNLIPIEYFSTIPPTSSNPSEFDNPVDQD